jgi:hypothetical protein
LEFYFSACLTAAQSAHYVLKKAPGRQYTHIKEKWLKERNDPEGVRFDRMIQIRDDDVHLGTTGATPLPKYIEEDQRSNPYMVQNYNDETLFGLPVVPEETNPDGRKVSAPILRGTVGLYLDHDGVRLVEATTFCRDFIGLLRSLLEVTRPAFTPSARS